MSRSLFTAHHSPVNISQRIKLFAVLRIEMHGIRWNPAIDIPPMNGKVEIYYSKRRTVDKMNPMPFKSNHHDGTKGIANKK